MGQNKESEILHDWEENGLSYRSLARKYGLSCSRIYRMVMSKQQKQEKPEVPKAVLKERRLYRTT